MKKLGKILVFIMILFFVPCNFVNDKQVPLANIGAYKFVERINTMGMQLKTPIKLVNLHQQNMEKYTNNPNSMLKKYDTYVATFNTGSVFFLCNHEGYVCGISIITPKDKTSEKESTYVTYIVGRILLNNKDKFEELIHTHKCWSNNRWIFWTLDTRRNVYNSLFLAYDS